MMRFFRRDFRRERRKSPGDLFSRSNCRCLALSAKLVRPAKGPFPRVL